MSVCQRCPWHPDFRRSPPRCGDQAIVVIRIGLLSRLVAGEAFWLMGAGLLVGVAGSVALQSVVAGQLYGVKPLDPMVMSAVILTLAVVGLAACVLPARRATRVDPVMVLREQ